MFRIKICGVTRTEDVRHVVDAGADAIGLNFYARSPRHVGLETARALTELMPPAVARVGVFVNAPLDMIATTARTLALNYCQLHGDEPPELARELAEWPVIRAVRCRAADVNSVVQWVDRCREAGGKLAALLIDAYQPGQFGGTGAVADWSLLATFRRLLPDLPLVLAGGLTAENVAQAIQMAGPDAVDTASGVESSPGVKDPDKTVRFVTAARQAWSVV